MKTEKENSLEIVYDRYAGMLMRVAYSMLQNREDAEDAVQNVFFKYLKKQPTFSSDEQQKAWLIKVTVNQCKDALRRRSFRSHLGLQEIEDVGKEDHHPHPMMELIFTLPEKYRQAVVLHYLEDLSVAETAKILGVSESAVKMRLSRGREMLKELFGEEENDT